MGTVQAAIQRSGDRFLTRYENGVVSRHSFSFGAHYDPANVGFGLLVSNNEDTLPPRGGYGDHPHRETEIVTWVLEGEVHHRDSTGHAGAVVPGEVQVLSAGSGVRHQEYAGAGPARFVQMWVRPDVPGGPPRYLHEPMPLGADWATVPGLRSTRARLHAIRLGPEAVLPVAPYLHVYVCRGSMALETGDVLGEGDALRVTGSDGARVRGDAELLAWAMTPA